MIETLHGLPQDVVFCKKCVMSNQRPASTPEFGKRQTKDTNSAPFGDDGICDACRFFEYKQTINWDERRLELQELCDRYRSKDGSWDVIVPGSGGKDSIFVAHILKNEFGMIRSPSPGSSRIHRYWLAQSSGMATHGI